MLAWLLLAGLVLPALALTALRLAAPEQGLPVRLVSFAPVALPLYALALVVGLLVMAARHRGGHGGGLVPVVVALAGLAVHSWWLAPYWTGDEQVAARPAYTLTVMSSNLLVGRADEAQVLRTAAEYGVDLLVVQEITPEALGELERLGLGEAYPHRAGEPADSPAGTMVFSTRPLTAVERLETDFGSYAMDVAAEGGPFRLYAVHPGPPTGDAGGWRADLDAIAAAVARDEGVDLVVGDFNATADHAPFRRVLDAGLRDAAEMANTGWQPTWPVDGRFRVLGVPLPTVVAIDHVLVGDQLVADDVVTVEIDGTDHRAVVASLAAGGEGG